MAILQRKVDEMQVKLGQVLKVVTKLQLDVLDILERTKSKNVLENNKQEQYHIINSFMPLESVERMQEFCNLIKDSTELQDEFVSI